MSYVMLNSLSLYVTVLLLLTLVTNGYYSTLLTHIIYFTHILTPLIYSYYFKAKPTFNYRKTEKEEFLWYTH